MLSCSLKPLTEQRPLQSSIVSAQDGSCSRSQVLLGCLYHILLTDKSCLALGTNVDWATTLKWLVKLEEVLRLTWMLSLFEWQEEEAIQMRLNIQRKGDGPCDQQQPAGLRDQGFWLEAWSSLPSQRRSYAHHPEQFLGPRNTSLNLPQSVRAHGSFPQELNYCQRGSLTKCTK